MKKLMIFAAVCAALVACSKDSPVSDGSFKKGQKVTLMASATSSTKISSVQNGDAVDFIWEENDQILVIVDNETAIFTLKTGAGTGKATFEGEMPASGDTFDVQYPVDGVGNLEAQTYSSAEAVAHDMIYLKASDCKVNESFTLEQQYALLRLNLWGTGQTISKIVVTNTTSSETPKPTYALTVDPAVTLPTTEAEAQAFFIVVSSGDWNFSAEVFDNAETPASICTFIPSASQTFNNSQILNMPAKKVGKFYPGTESEGIKIGDVTWAPVNCGYDAAAYPYGKLYQWGRKDGCGYNDGSTYTETLIQESCTGPVDGSTIVEDPNYFYLISMMMDQDWLETPDDTRWNSGSESSPVKTSYDPCPDGWRVPTVDELGSLCYTDWDSTEQTGNTPCGSWDSTNNGWNFGSLFLPAAGLRRSYDGVAFERGEFGYYWSSSSNVVTDYWSPSGSHDAWGLSFSDDGESVDGYCARAAGNSVRCVQE